MFAAPKKNQRRPARDTVTRTPKTKQSTTDRKRNPTPLDSAHMNNPNHRSKVKIHADMHSGDSCVSIMSRAVKSQNLTLERVLGNSIQRPSSIALNPSMNGSVAYSAGSVVVQYDYDRNRQSFITPSQSVTGSGTHFSLDGPPEGHQRVTVGTANSHNTKPVSTICYSPDGAYLGIGESGHQPRIFVWDSARSAIVSVLQGHKFGVEILAFSPNMKYLVSVGYQDGQLFVWNWRRGEKYACGRLEAKIHGVSFHSTGAYFVTVGSKHFKFWHLDSNQNIPMTLVATSNDAAGTAQTLALLEGVSAELFEWKDSTFVDVVCSKARPNDVTLEDASHPEDVPETHSVVYTITERGVLCTVLEDTLTLSKYMDLKVSGGAALDVSDQFVVCGCTAGHVRIFSLALSHIKTIYPYQLGVEIGVNIQTPHSKLYPDVISVKIQQDSQKIISVFSDRSMYVWDIADVTCPRKSRVMLNHSDCVWGVENWQGITKPWLLSDSASLVEGIPASKEQAAFITYSSDGSVRFWSLENPQSEHSVLNQMTGEDDQPRKTHFGNGLLRVLYLDRSGLRKICKSLQHENTLTEESNPIPDRTGIRALKISSDGVLMATGDRTGSIRVHDLRNFKQLECIEAHTAEILSIDFAQHGGGIVHGSGPWLMATASRDRLIQVFNVCQPSTAHTENPRISLIQTLDDHSSTITSVKFGDCGNRLLSCGADKSIIFRSAVASTKPEYHTDHVQVTRCTQSDMDLERTGRFAVAASQDRRLNVYCVQSGKLVRSYRLDPVSDPLAADHPGPVGGSVGVPGVGGFQSITMDPSGLYAATTAADKLVRIFDVYSGVCVARVGGHSELVTSVRFTQDGARLITTSADGCVFIWTVASPLVRNMRNQLSEQGKTKLPISEVLHNEFKNPSPGEHVLQQEVDRGSTAQDSDIMHNTQCSKFVQSENIVSTGNCYEPPFHQLESKMSEGMGNFEAQEDCDAMRVGNIRVESVVEMTTHSADHYASSPFAKGRAGLPTWARSAAERNSLVGVDSTVSIQHRIGSWAQRVNADGIRLHSQVETIQNPVARLEDGIPRKFSLDSSEILMIIDEQSPIDENSPNNAHVKHVKDNGKSKQVLDEPLITVQGRKCLADVSNKTNGNVLRNGSPDEFHVTRMDDGLISITSLSYNSENEEVVPTKLHPAHMDPYQKMESTINCQNMCATEENVASSSSPSCSPRRLHVVRQNHGEQIIDHVLGNFISGNKLIARSENPTVLPEENCANPEMPIEDSLESIIADSDDNINTVPSTAVPHPLPSDEDVCSQITKSEQEASPNMIPTSTRSGQKFRNDHFSQHTLNKMVLLETLFGKENDVDVNDKLPPTQQLVPRDNTYKLHTQFESQASSLKAFSDTIPHSIMLKQTQQRKESTAEEVEKMRKKLASMGIMFTSEKSMIQDEHSHQYADVKNTSYATPADKPLNLRMDMNKPSESQWLDLGKVNPIPAQSCASHTSSLPPLRTGTSTQRVLRFKSIKHVKIRCSFQHGQVGFKVKHLKDGNRLNSSICLDDRLLLHTSRCARRTADILCELINTQPLGCASSCSSLPETCQQEEPPNVHVGQYVDANELLNIFSHFVVQNVKNQLQP